MAYLDDYNDGKNADFVAKIEVALLVLANAHLDATDVADPSAASRKRRLARALVLEPNHYAKVLAPLIAANSVLGPASTDVDIQTALNNNLAKLAWMFE